MRTSIITEFLKRFMQPLLWCGLGLFLLSAIAHAETAMDDDAETRFSSQLESLVSGNLRERREQAALIAASGHPRAARILNALLDGRLLSQGGGDEPLQIIVRMADSDALEDAASGRRMDSAEGARVVPINNPLRNALRDLIAMAEINHADPQRRLLASERLMVGDLNTAQMQLLRGRLSNEEDDAVKEALAIAIAVGQLKDPTAEQRIEALDVLRGALHAHVRGQVAAVAQNDADAQVRRHAEQTMAAIQNRISLYRFSENLFFGLSLGSVLLLAALGLAITFGVMGVINMAHGELIMIGAYTTWFLQTLMPTQLTLSLWLAIPSAFLVAGLVGIAMERGVIRFLYGRPLETLLATFGLSLILQQAVRSIFSPLNQAVSSPEWISGSVALNPVLSLTWNRIYVLAFALLVFVVLLLILKRTTLGLKVRAVSQNRAMAQALGVRAHWVDAMTFGLGAGIAGVAGVALAQLSNVGPNMGQSYIIDSFMVVVLGGVGNIWGTFVGAFGLGIMNKFLEPYAGAVLAKIVVLLFIILFIQYRPRGLFPQKGRSAEG
jgi:urea transport system permease protein